MARRWWIDPLVFVAITLAVNGLIFAFGWSDPPASRSALAPPGAVIGTVWVALLALLGVAHARLRACGDAARSARRLAQFLFVLCISYPFYTAGLSDLRLGLAGNLLVLLVAACSIVVAAPRDRAAALLVLPMIGWLGYACAIIGSELAR